MRATTASSHVFSLSHPRLSYRGHPEIVVLSSAFSSNSVALSLPIKTRRHYFKAARGISPAAAPKRGLPRLASAARRESVESRALVRRAPFQSSAGPGLVTPVMLAVLGKGSRQLLWCCRLHWLCPVHHWRRRAGLGAAGDDIGQQRLH